MIEDEICDKGCVSEKDECVVSLMRMDIGVSVAKGKDLGEVMQLFSGWPAIVVQILKLSNLDC